MIQRYLLATTASSESNAIPSDISIEQSQIQSDNGQWVKFADHEAEIAAKDAEIAGAPLTSWPTSETPLGVGLIYRDKNR